MKAAFFKTIEELAERDKDIFILTGDLGFKLFDNFREKYPDKFYNIGVAEANMISIAAGLSLCGKTVYCYSIIPFLVMRAFEQIRVDVAYQNLNVKLVGFGAGFSYSLEGFTHFGLEDLALMRTLPNMTIVVPANTYEARCLAKASLEYKGPIYIRLERAEETITYQKSYDLEIGKAMLLREGKDVAIFAVGNMVYTGKRVADLLASKGIKATLVNMHTLKPLDSETIMQIASTHESIFSLEEHIIDGGLGSAIAEVLAEGNYNGFFKRIGIEKLKYSIGNANFLREEYGLTVEKIYYKILESIGGRKFLRVLKVVDFEIEAKTI